MFSNIYMKYHPHKSGELIQYNHIIHSITMTYTWENIYSYDKEFRLHISRHPERNWGVILQQAWSMRLKDRLSGIRGDYMHNNSSTPSQSQSGNDTKRFGEYCKHFNKGKCNLGSGCRYEHRCLYCNKFRHRVFMCRKLIFDRECNDRNSNNKKSPAVQNKNANPSK